MTFNNPVPFDDFLPFAKDLDSIVLEIHSEAKGTPPLIEDVYGTLLQIIHINNVITILTHVFIDELHANIRSDDYSDLYNRLLDLGKNEDFTYIGQGQSLLTSIREVLPNFGRFKEKTIDLRLNSACVRNPLETEILAGGASFAMIILSGSFMISRLDAFRVRMRLIDLLNENMQHLDNATNKKLFISGLLKIIEGSTKLKSGLGITLKAGDISIKIEADDH